jgi:hypothetical protein
MSPINPAPCPSVADFLEELRRRMEVPEPAVPLDELLAYLDSIDPRPVRTN